MAVQSAYSVYRQWCLDHGHAPCTPSFFYREDNSLLPWATPSPRNDVIDADQREIDRERAEGWAYDKERESAA
jgi:hypothetical protein